MTGVGAGGGGGGQEVEKNDKRLVYLLEKPNLTTNICTGVRFWLWYSHVQFV